jgi:hypothetical protein
VRVKRPTIMAAVAIAAVLATPAGAVACSCAPVEPEAAMRNADAAIIGRLVEVMPRGDLRADFRYRVQQVYKSGRGLTRGAVIVVRSNLQGVACGLPTSEGRRYGLFLDRSEGGWAGSLCAVVEPQRLSSAAGDSSRRSRSSPAQTLC